MKSPLSRLSRLVRRATPRPRRTPRTASHHVPWWVRWFTNAGRPIVAVVVLIMCAPGEHHLAVLAGWDGRLAWGMAAVLAAYAGIAASVASNRPTGAPGKRSAVVGAVVSLGAAMAAQPVSHLFVTGHLSSSPRTPLWLVVIVSCVPPLVFGHLLHLAATPTGQQPETADEEPATPKPQPVPEAPPTFRWSAVVPQDAVLLPIVASHTETPDEEHAAPEPQPVPAPVADAAPAPLWGAVVPAGAVLLPIVASHTETADDQDETDEGEPRLIETREVAALKGVKPSTVRTWVERGRLNPVVRDARNGMLFDRDDVEAMA